MSSINQIFMLLTIAFVYLCLLFLLIKSMTSDHFLMRLIRLILVAASVSFGALLWTNFMENAINYLESSVSFGIRFSSTLLSVLFSITVCALKSKTLIHSGTLTTLGGFILNFALSPVLELLIHLIVLHGIPGWTVYREANRKYIIDIPWAWLFFVTLYFVFGGYFLVKATPSIIARIQKNSSVVPLNQAVTHTPNTGTQNQTTTNVLRPSRGKGLLVNAASLVITIVILVLALGIVIVGLKVYFAAKS